MTVEHITLAIKIISISLITTIVVQGQHKATWNLFQNAIYEDAYIEAYDSYASLLVCNDEMNALKNQALTITGYYIPVEEDVFIISRFPNATCFFCGAAGMESVMEVRMNTSLPFTPITDDLMTFKGKLKVNCTEWEYVSFILEDAHYLGTKK